MVPPIVPQGISSQQSPHDRRDRYWPCSEKKMKVVGDQCPCITDGLCILENASQALQKMIPVGIIPEYRAPFNAPDHYMVNGSGSVNSGFPRHDTPLSPCPMVCQLNNLPASLFSASSGKSSLVAGFLPLLGAFFLLCGLPCPSQSGSISPSCVAIVVPENRVDQVEV